MFNSARAASSRPRAASCSLSVWASANSACSASSLGAAPDSKRSRAAFLVRSAKPRRFGRHLQTTGRRHQLEIRHTDGAPDVERLHDQIGCGPGERRVREIDPPRTLAAEFQRHADAERFMRCIAAGFERCLRVGALLGDVDAGEIHRASEARRDQRGVMCVGERERGLQRQRRRRECLGRLLCVERGNDRGDAAEREQQRWTVSDPGTHAGPPWQTLDESTITAYSGLSWAVHLGIAIMHRQDVASEAPNGERTADRIRSVYANPSPLIDVDALLPPDLGKWPVSHPMAKWLASAIHGLGCGSVLEFGAGWSSLVIAEARPPRAEDG